MIDEYKKALDALKKYRPSCPEKTSKEDFELGKKLGLMFDPIRLSHDEIIAWAIKEFDQSNKKEIVASFLYGYGQNQPEYRAAISAFAIMTNFPNHTYQRHEISETSSHCPICAMWEEEEVDLAFSNGCRWAGSIILSRRPYNLAFYLQQQRKIKIHLPEHSDITKFVELLNIIRASEEKETPTTLRKRLSKTSPIKMKAEEIEHLLDTLGYCGILQTEKHQGFIYKYIGYLNPRKSRSSYWGYPVDFWTGKDGINIDALKYWFSDYPEIANWRP